MTAAVTKLQPNKADAVICIPDSNKTADTAYHCFSLEITEELHPSITTDIPLDFSATHRTNSPALASDLSAISMTEPIWLPLPPPLHQSSCWKFCHFEPSKYSTPPHAKSSSSLYGCFYYSKPHPNIPYRRLSL